LLHNQNKTVHQWHAVTFEIPCRFTKATICLKSYCTYSVLPL